MQLVKIAGLFACQALWRLTRLRVAGRVLVRALADPDEDVHTIAAMFLVRSGARATSLLEEALERRKGLPMAMAVLADIGDRRYEPRLREFARDADPQIAQPAEDALRILKAHQG